MSLTLPVITTAAILDSLNPCAISVLLLTVGFLISLESSRRKILGIGSLYIIGIFVTYILIGLGVLSALSFFGFPKAITKIGAALLAISSILNLLESYYPKFPISLGIPQFIKPKLGQLMYKASGLAAFGMGILVGLFEFPCTGGPYLFILSLLHDSATLSIGTLLLIYYNLIFVSPLVLILALASQPAITQRIQEYRKTHSKNLALFTSLATLLLAIIIFIL